MRSLNQPVMLLAIMVGGFLLMQQHQIDNLTTRLDTTENAIHRMEDRATVAPPTTITVDDVMHWCASEYAEACNYRFLSVDTDRRMGFPIVYKPFRNADGSCREATFTIDRRDVLAVKAWTRDDNGRPTSYLVGEAPTSIKSGCELRFFNIYQYMQFVATGA